MKTGRQAILFLCMLALLTCSWLAPLDAPATQQVDAGLKRALISFATARTLNGIISVLQGTEIDIQPAGIGATLTPGQMLAPVNELVKHFADLMLLASVAFGIQKVLISISGYWLISLSLTATGIGWIAFQFWQGGAPRWLSRLLVILLMLRFAIPVVVVGSDSLSQKCLAADYSASQQAIDLASSQTAAAKLPEPAIPENAGVIEKLKGMMPKIPDFKARFEEMKHIAERTTEHVINLMVIFLLQTLIMPFLLMWGLYGVTRGIFESQRYPRLHAV